MANQRNPFGHMPKAIIQYKDGKVIHKFKSIKEACDYIRKSNPNANVSHISNCANGRIKSAYGFNWKFAKQK